MSDVLTIKDKIILDYPLPIEASIWSSFDMDELLRSCLDDVQSDLELYDSVTITKSPYVLPKGTRQVTSVKVLSLLSIQANQFVRHTFDKSTLTVATRFVPALVSFKRDVTMADLDSIRGSVLQYFKAYVTVKMLDKEIAYLTVIKLESNTGQIDLEALRSLRADLNGRLDRMRLDILIPSNG